MGWNGMTWDEFIEVNLNYSKLNTTNFVGLYPVLVEFIFRSTEFSCSERQRLKKLCLSSTVRWKLDATM